MVLNHDDPDPDNPTISSASSSISTTSSSSFADYDEAARSFRCRSVMVMVRECWLFIYQLHTGTLPFHLQVVPSEEG